MPFMAFVCLKSPGKHHPYVKWLLLLLPNQILSLFSFIRASFHKTFDITQKNNGDVPIIKYFLRDYPCCSRYAQSISKSDFFVNK